MYLLTPSTVALWKNAFIEYWRPALLRRLREGRTKCANCSLRFGWFTEGFDTRDLKEAIALLEEFGALTVC
jgi:hypothetical protein